MEPPASTTHAPDGAQTLPPEIAARVRKAEALLAVAALTFGALGLAARLADRRWLATLGFAVPMQPNTAIGIVLLSAAVLLGRLPRGRVAAAALALPAALLGAFTLVEHATGADLGLSRLVVRVPAEPGVVRAGQMGPPAALHLLVLGAAVALRALARPRATAAAAWLAAAMLPVSSLAVVGYAYQVGALVELPRATAIALPTALALAALASSLGIAPVHGAPFAGLWSGGPGGALARGLLPWVLLLPPCMGAMALWSAGPWPALAVAGLAVALAGALVAVLLRTALPLDRLHAAREQALADRLASREELARALARERDARAEAERAGRVKDEVLATLSHELRTPLNAMLGWAGLLRGAANDPVRLAHGLEVVERNGRALARHVSDLLDMSRLAAGALPLERVEVDLAKLLDREAARAGAEARAKGVAFGSVAGLVPLRVRGDPGRLAQVLAILLGNAVKFTPAGGRVDVRAAAGGGSVHVVVADTGVGVRRELLPALFEPFVQADGSPSRAHGGLGLGLAIARELVRLHGGRLSAESDGPDRGATFRLELPLVEARSAAAWRGPVLQGSRVLVVEDDGDSRDVLVQLLGSWGACAIGAGSAAEALAEYAREPPDLVVSDLAMPGQDGASLAAELRALERARGLPAVPLVALTAFARPEDRERTHAAGFDAHLAKPVEPDALRATLAAMRGGAAVSRTG